MLFQRANSNILIYRNEYINKVYRGVAIVKGVTTKKKPPQKKKEIKSFY